MGSERLAPKDKPGAAVSRHSSPQAPSEIAAPPARGSVLAEQVLGLQKAAGNRAVSRAVRVGAIRPARLVLARLVKNPFNDPTAFKDAPSAAKAIEDYKALVLVDRRDSVKGSYKKDLVRVLAALSRADQVQKYRDPIREITRWVEEEETRASAAMTDDQIATTQKDFLKKQAEAAAAAEVAKKAPKDKPPPKPTQAEVEAERKKQVESTSIKPAGPSGWDAMSAKEKADWTTAGNDAVKKVVAHANAKHPELALKDTHFRVAFKDVEKRGATVIAFGESDGAGGTRAAVGFAFVRAVKLDPAYVMDVVVHEVAGHPEYGRYGTEYHLALYDAAMAKTPGYIKPAGGTPARTSEIDAYAYQETEMYSVLRSMPYRTAPKPADVGKVPNLDTRTIVTYRVGLMKKQWAPTLIVPILRGYRMRLVIDPRITAAALKVFDDAVLTNFDAATLAKVKK
jgi:hypothetical protein